MIDRRRLDVAVGEAVGALGAVPHDARGEGGNDPQNWRIDVPQGHIDLHMELRYEPRELSAKEARMMLELVDAWRDLEHIGQKSAEAGPGPKTRKRPQPL
jgi:hypothetical protein